MVSALNMAVQLAGFHLPASKLGGHWLQVRQAEAVGTLRPAVRKTRQLCTAQAVGLQARQLRELQGARNESKFEGPKVGAGPAAKAMDFPNLSELDLEYWNGDLKLGKAEVGSNWLL